MMLCPRTVRLKVKEEEVDAWVMIPSNKIYFRIEGQYQERTTTWLDATLLPKLGYGVLQWIKYPGLRCETE